MGMAAGRIPTRPADVSTHTPSGFASCMAHLQSLLMAGSTGGLILQGAPPGKPASGAGVGDYRAPEQLLVWAPGGHQ